MKDESDITVIFDKSGSMESTASDAIGGFNQFLMEQQRQSGECRLTLIQFDHRHEVVYAGRPIAEVPRLTTETFEPRGGTALLTRLAGPSTRPASGSQHFQRPNGRIAS